MFRKFGDRLRVRAAAGERTHQLRKLQADRNGVLELVPDGKEDRYEMIQSFRDSADIHVMMKRFENGDATILSQRVGSFGDVSQLPGTFHEVLNACIDAENTFKKLPKSVRAKFNNSVTEFLAGADDPKSFVEKVGADIARKLGFGLEVAAAGAAAEAAAGAAKSGSAQPSGEPDGGAAAQKGEKQ